MVGFLEQYGFPLQGPAKKVLLLGGTNYAGPYVARLLVKQGHDVTLLTRGIRPPVIRIPDETDAELAEYTKAVKHIMCDRDDITGMQAVLSSKDAKEFQVIVDTIGNNAKQVKPVLDTLPTMEQYIFLSNEGVYFNDYSLIPALEEDTIGVEPRTLADPNAWNKLEAERLLEKQCGNYTILRINSLIAPPGEEFFFLRIKAKKPIPIPGTGQTLLQVGIVKDLAVAVAMCVGNPKARNQVFNITGKRAITFDNYAKACAKAMGEPCTELIHYNPLDFPGVAIYFPFIQRHSCMSIDKAEDVLGWTPKTTLLDGLKEAYNGPRSGWVPNWDLDKKIIDKVKPPPAEVGVASFAVPAEKATVVWLDTPEQYLTVAPAPGSNSSSGNAVRLNKVMWLELTANAPSVGVRPGTYQGRARIQLLPGWTAEELTVTATPAPGCGAPASRTYPRAELATLGNGWVELTTGPMVLSKAGHVAVKIHAFKTSDWKKGILFDELKLSA